jgi:hypothetical protein
VYTNGGDQFVLRNASVRSPSPAQEDYEPLDVQLGYVSPRPFLPSYWTDDVHLLCRRELI